MITKTQSIVFAFAALLVAMPFATQNAQAVDLVITGVCGLTVVGGSGGVDLGAITPGVDGAESSVVTITTDGTLPGTFEISAADWVSSGTSATGYLTLSSVVATNSTVTINGELFTATAATQDVNNFVAGSDSVSATNLATAINANTSVLVTAQATEDIVLLRSDGITTTANSIGTTSSDGTITPSAATLTGATDAGAVIIQSEITRYSITNTGIAPGSNAYSAKTPLEVSGVNDIVVPLIDVSEDLLMVFQVTGTLDDPDFVGTVTQDLTFNAICV